MQDAAAEALLRLPQLREPRAFRNWFNQIVVFLVRKQRRRRRPMVDLEAVSAVPASVRPDDRLAAREAARLLESLPERLQRVVWLRHVDGLPIEEIATVLRTSRATVNRDLAAASAVVGRALHGDERPRRRLALILAVLGRVLDERRTRRAVLAGGLAGAMGALLVRTEAPVLPAPSVVPATRTTSTRGWPLPPAPADDGGPRWRDVATPSDAFVDGMGVNLRLGEGPQPLPLVQARLGELGLRHVIDLRRSRLDGLATLEPMGVRTTLFVDADTDAHAAAAAGSFVEAIVMRHDRPGLPVDEWARQRRAWLAISRARLAADPATRGTPVVGAPIAGEERRMALGDAVDMGGSGAPSWRLPPGGVFLDATLAAHRRTWGANDPVVVPQVAHSTAACGECVDEDAHARYAVRTFLENHRRGVHRTF